MPPVTYLRLALTLSLHDRACAPHTQVEPLLETQPQLEKVYAGRGRTYHGGGEDSRHQMDQDRQDVDAPGRSHGGTHGGMAKKYPDQRAWACSYSAATPHTVGSRSTRLCSKGKRGQPPAAPPARSTLLAPRATAPLSLSLCMWPIGRPLQTREERSVAAPPIYRGAHSQRCRRLLPPFFPPSRLSKLFQEPLEQRDARAGAARGKGCS